jgi:hypothetical protein
MLLICRSGVIAIETNNFFSHFAYEDESSRILTSIYVTDMPSERFGGTNSLGFAPECKVRLLTGSPCTIRVTITVLATTLGVEIPELSQTKTVSSQGSLVQIHSAPPKASCFDKRVTSEAIHCFLWPGLFPLSTEGITATAFRIASHR